MNIISYIKVVIEAITGFNECDTFIQRLRSLRSRSNGIESQELKEDDALKLKNSLQCLRDTLPVMYNFIDRVEWRSHEDSVAELLPKLRAAVYDAEDLLENFRCYEQKVKIEGSATSVEPGDKLHNIIQDNFEKLTHIKERLDNQFLLLERMGLHQATPRFDRSVRPETTRFPTEAKIFGRDDEIKELIRRLGVHSSPKRKRSAIPSPADEATITGVPVLPIFGIGGVGKTTWAQNIISHPQVQKHFDVIVWICVSDDFDVRRLTKEAIEQFSRKAEMKDNLDSLQVDLTDSINKRRFLVVLDDMWAENEELWKRFYAPFKNVLEGSMILVTTRSEKVANIVRTMEPFLLEGLKDNVFKSFFKLCVFGSDSSNNSPESESKKKELESKKKELESKKKELESIGEQILPKLKGSPLAAKTLGRLLGMRLDPEHWNSILNNQLWKIKQEETEILPALRLSYIYLPIHLKRCFSFCAVYPKDYNFEKEDLAEIWVAEGFVEPEHNIPLQQTACRYFEELAHLSFFQKLRGKYVIHDLIHDMAQLVSKDECFIIKEKNDLKWIPQNVRHLSVLKSRDVKLADLESLCKQTKLRTLLCNMSLKSKIGNTMMEKWCTELLCMRVMVCASISKSGLPDSISNMKNLRYLKISDACPFDRFPAALCELYNLQVLSARKCRIEAIPRGFSNLINLQKFESKALRIDAGLLNNFNLITGDFSICKLSEISKLMKKKDPFKLTLDCSLERHVHNEIEAFQALQPPTNIKSVCLTRYPGQYFPRWFNGSDDSATIFSSLTEVEIKNCPWLSSLEHFLQPAYVPAIKKMVISHCESLECLSGGWPILEKLSIWFCPRLKWQNGIVLPSSLQTLSLRVCGYFCVSCLENLTTLESLRMINCKHIEYIPSNLWSSNRITLKELEILHCEDLVRIGGPEAIAHIPKVKIYDCLKLEGIQQPLLRG